MTETSTRTPCSDRSASERVPLIGTKSTAEFIRARKPSLLVSLADKTHNAEAILFDYQAIGDDLWARFNGGKDGTIWYYQSLARVFRGQLPGRLSDRLDRAVRAFSEACD